MKWISLIFLFHLLNSSSGCLKINQLTCSCGSFLDIMKEPEIVLYTQYPGCDFNATCGVNYNTHLYGRWGEVPRPDDAGADYFLTIDYGKIYEERLSEICRCGSFSCPQGHHEELKNLNFLNSSFKALETYRRLLPFRYIDLYYFFGLRCKEGKWYATYYPRGITYQTIGGGTNNVYWWGELNGKNTEIFSGEW
uniref:Uncharacterized protein n=1 Tax=Caenorhabditis tropicalis TaxID=1561998 RepID=A0A1I7TGW2_9PELO